MARIRSIKPEFWTSEQVMECSTTARLLFIGMWNFCDDAGRHPASSKTLKAEVFPGDDITSDEVGMMLDELEANGLIERYEVSERQYFQVTGWHHQKIEKKNVRHPGPEIRLQVEDRSPNESTTNRRPIDDHSTPEGKGREWKGCKPPISPDGEISPPSKKTDETPGRDLIEKSSQPAASQTPTKPDPKGHRLPDDWVLPAQWGRWAMEDAAAQGVRVTAEEVRRTAEKFADYWGAKGGKEARKTDWQATWRNWWRRDIDDRKSRPNGSKSDERQNTIAALTGESGGGFTIEGDARLVG